MRSAGGGGNVQCHLRDVCFRRTCASDCAGQCTWSTADTSATASGTCTRCLGAGCPEPLPFQYKHAGDCACPAEDGAKSQFAAAGPAYRYEFKHLDGQPCALDEYILTAAECEHAARRLQLANSSGVVDTRVCNITNEYAGGAESCCAGSRKSTGTAANLPFGCYYKVSEGQTQEDRLWFNAFGDRDLVDPVRPSVCKSSVDTTAAAPTAPERCTKLNDTTGAYQGQIVATLANKDAPTFAAGVGWTWPDCARRCAATGSCAYWLVRQGKGCVLKAGQGKFVRGGGVVAHGTKDCRCGAGASAEGCASATATTAVEAAAPPATTAPPVTPVTLAPRTIPTAALCPAGPDPTTCGVYTAGNCGAIEFGVRVADECPNLCGCRMTTAAAATSDPAAAATSPQARATAPSRTKAPPTGATPSAAPQDNSGDTLPGGGGGGGGGSSTSVVSSTGSPPVAVSPPATETPSTAAAAAAAANTHAATPATRTPAASSDTTSVATSSTAGAATSPADAPSKQAGGSNRTLGGGGGGAAREGTTLLPAAAITAPRKPPATADVGWSTATADSADTELGGNPDGGGTTATDSPAPTTAAAPPGGESSEDSGSVVVVASAVAAGVVACVVVLCVAVCCARASRRRKSEPIPDDHIVMSSQAYSNSRHCMSDAQEIRNALYNGSMQGSTMSSASSGASSATSTFRDRVYSEVHTLPTETPVAQASGEGGDVHSAHGMQHDYASFVAGTAAQAPVAHDYRNHVSAGQASASALPPPPLGSHDYRLASVTSDGSAAGSEAVAPQRSRLPSEGGDPQDYRNKAHDYRLDGHASTSAHGVRADHHRYQVLGGQPAAASHLYELAPEVAPAPITMASITAAGSSAGSDAAAATSTAAPATAMATATAGNQGSPDAGSQAVPAADATQPPRGREPNSCPLQNYEVPISENPDYHPSIDYLPQTQGGGATAGAPASPIYDEVDEGMLGAGAGRTRTRTSSYKAATLDGQQRGVTYMSQPTPTEPESATSVVMRATCGRGDVPAEHVYSQVDRSTQPSSPATAAAAMAREVDLFNPFNDDSVTATIPDTVYDKLTMAGQLPLLQPTGGEGPDATAVKYLEHDELELGLNPSTTSRPSSTAVLYSEVQNGNP